MLLLQLLLKGLILSSHTRCVQRIQCSLTHCNEYNLHESDIIQSSSRHVKREKRKKSKLYLLENARQFWVILQLYYSPQVQDFFLQKEKHMRKAEEEGRLVDFQVQFQFLDLCLHFAWNSSMQIHDRIGSGQNTYPEIGIQKCSRPISLQHVPGS